MDYHVVLSRKAEKFLDKSTERERILDKLEVAAEDPFQHLQRLVGSPLWKLRIGKNRAICQIVIKGRTVYVVNIGNRSNVY